MAYLTREIIIATQRIMVVPGSIWILPVNYVMEYPPNYLVRDGTKVTLQRDTSMWHENNSPFYKSVNAEVVLTTEVRPFLVFQDFTSIVARQELGIPHWYADTVSGFPISSLENLRRRSDTEFKVDVDSLLTKNDYDFIHYLKRSEKNHLLYESYIVLSAVAAVNLKFLTHKIGNLDNEDFVSMQAKIKRHFYL